MSFVDFLLGGCSSPSWSEPENGQQSVDQALEDAAGAEEEEQKDPDDHANHNSCNRTAAQPAAGTRLLSHDDAPVGADRCHERLCGCGASDARDSDEGVAGRPERS